MKIVSKFFLAGLVALTGFAFTAAAQDQSSRTSPIEATKTVAPTFPHELVGGEVVVRLSFTLNERGEPRNIRVLEAPNFSYILSAKRAVREWRFDIAEGADLSNTRIHLPVVFSYSD
ncbi:MAG: hypothetical protein SynsKO_02620 [Synoicihabitans sp.]